MAKAAIKKSILISIMLASCLILLPAFAADMNVPNTPQDAQKVWSHLNSMTLRQNDEKVSDEAKKAFIDIYGGSIWQDESLAYYFKGQTSGYVTPIFEARFTEGGMEKLLVLGHITPEPMEGYWCHACYPLLGGAIFLKQGSVWVVESMRKVIGWGDVFGGGRFSIIPISPAKYGVAIRIADAHQGYEDLRAEILVPHHGNLDVALDVGYREKPGSGACEVVELLPQNVDMRFEPGKNSGYFDTVIQVQYNDGNCEHFVRHAETVRYQFHDGKYQPI